MNSVSSASRSRVASTKSVASTLETNRNVSSRSAVVAQRLVGHHRPEVRAADADVDDVADPLAGVAGPVAAAHPLGRTPPSGRAPRGPRRPRRRRRRRATRPCGMRSATCSTERSSDDVDPLAAEHRVDPRRASRDCSASCDEQPDGLVGDPVLGVVEVQSGGLGDEPLAALADRRRTGRADAGRDAPRSVSPTPSTRRARPAARSCSERRRPDRRSASTMSFHESVKLFAPSDWSLAPRAATSTPAASNSASVASASPPSVGIGASTAPWSWKATSVDSGIVLTVWGALRRRT